MLAARISPWSVSTGSTPRAVTLYPAAMFAAAGDLAICTQRARTFHRTRRYSDCNTSFFMREQR